MNSFAILSAAEITNSDAIHPGAGFFSENYEFSSMVKKHKITFIGPTSKQIKIFGDKINAKKLMKGQGRILVRKSGTESKIRVMGESENNELLQKCLNIILKKIK